MNKVLPDFISAYRKSFATNHFLRLIEDWKKSLDNKNIVEAVLIIFSKTFYGIPLYLLITKIRPYGISMDTLAFMYFYLKKRK